MDRKISRASTADVIETKPVTLAGVDTHPGWHALRTLARAHHHAAVARRLPAPGQSAVVGAGAAGPDPGGPARDAGLRDAGHQAGLGLQLRLRTRSVHRHRAAGRRPLAVALVFVDVQPAHRRAPARVTITVKAMPEGFLSAHLVAGVQPGTIVRLAAPQGNFVLPDPAPPAVLFVTAGSGITPVMSMLRTLVRRDQITDVDPSAFGAHRGRRDVRRGARAAGRATTRDTGCGCARRAPRGGWILPSSTPRCRTGATRQTWACGPEAMLNAAEQAWSAAGIKDHLHLERFAVSRAAPAGAGGTVTFAKSGKSTIGRCGDVADGCR